MMRNKKRAISNFFILLAQIRNFGFIALSELL